MAEIKIKTEVAGRVCSIVAAIGVSVGDGEDVVVVEAMKMEIPVTATAAGKVKTILVSVDDMLTEGQVVAVIET
jgi:acetyl-CoA carboxylase biotin carboxyl carrier protein